MAFRDIFLVKGVVVALIEESLATFLEGQPLLEEFTGTAGERIYPLKIPAGNKQQPCMTYALVRTETERTIGNERAERQVRRYAFTVWGTNYQQVTKAAETLVSIIDDRARIFDDRRIERTWLEDQQDVYESDAQLNGRESIYAMKIVGPTI